LRNEGDVDAAVAAIVGACDGQRRLGDILATVATTSDVGLDAVAPAALPIVRRLIEQAFLLPVTTGPKRARQTVERSERGLPEQ
jgi:hypothetical protein